MPLLFLFIFLFFSSKQSCVLPRARMPRMLFSWLDTVSGACVAAFTCSTVTPSAISVSTKPCPFFTSNAHISVMIMSTTPRSVSGRLQLESILAAPLPTETGPWL